MRVLGDATLPVRGLIAAGAVGDSRWLLSPTRCRGRARRPAPVLFGAAQQGGVGGRALEVQVRLVFPGEPDAAERLDGVGGDAANAAEHVACAMLAASAGSSEPSVSAQTAWYAVERACSRSTSMSASRCLTAWNEPMGLPNCSRFLAYSTATSSMCCAAPTCSTASSAAPTCRAWVMTRSASSGPATKRAGASDSVDHGLRPGQVHGEQRGPLDPRSGGVDGVERDAVGSDGGHQQVVGAPASTTWSTRVQPTSCSSLRSGRTE